MDNEITPIPIEDRDINEEHDRKARLGIAFLVVFVLAQVWAYLRTPDYPLLNHTAGHSSGSGGAAILFILIMTFFVARITIGATVRLRRGRDLSGKDKLGVGDRNMLANFAFRMPVMMCGQPLSMMNVPHAWQWPCRISAGLLGLWLMAGFGRDLQSCRRNWLASGSRKRKRTPEGDWLAFNEMAGRCIIWTAAASIPSWLVTWLSVQWFGTTAMLVGCLVIVVYYFRLRPKDAPTGDAEDGK